ncbi:ATP-NAD kinase [Annulohypoxylon maeteangense]|uniref:ATP-NAD kinase n=1 Tax=Annulohypoxylon maeteangense TaxID=1927788 RepID=UPI0020078B5C|nr:ATP-NAD kinase [Annulohypoxylon maeteangense]KAI0883234.1 ATP-NAD kinase [Annulohypoxylon maeteangense]
MNGFTGTNESHDTNEDQHSQYNDHYSSASDEDNDAVEVTFDPSSLYRRKSSLIYSETDGPKFAACKSKAGATQCLVHQFLEGYRNENRKNTDREQNDNTHVTTTGLDSYVEPKGKPASPQVNGSPKDLDSDASTEAGQPDQESWKKARLGLDHNEGLNSRLLTKKQLTDMAWGVREMSRRLGSIRLKFKVRSVFLLTKAYDRELIPKTRLVAKWLLSKAREVRYTVYVEESLKSCEEFDTPGLLQELCQEHNDSDGVDKNATKKSLENRLRFWTEKMCRKRPHTFDFVITLGGDGTVLYASWLFQRIVPPVLSFSLGSLGFLTKFEFNEYSEILSTAFRDGVTVSLRLRFEGTVMRSQRKKNQLTQDEYTDDEGTRRKRDLIEELIGEERDDEHTHKPDGTYEILNEIVVDRGPNPTMSYTEIFGDDEHFTSVLADGVCVSTPTGSTAYNLAAGGSLCHPDNPVMLVTSVCAHTLSFRPIILPDTIVLRVGVPYDARTHSWASFDGRERVELRPGDYVTISASRFPFASVQPQGRRGEDWVKSISAKLGWNTRQRQKNEGFNQWNR